MPIPALLPRLAITVATLHVGLAAAALDVSGLDTAIDPCADFYRYANQKWITATPVPADRTVWGTFPIVDANNEAILLAAVEGACRDKASNDT